jgi:hypothetical protein
MRNKTIDLNIGYKDKLISNISHTIFFLHNSWQYTDLQ